MGGLVVENFNTDSDPGSAFVYDIGAASWVALPKTPLNAKILTAYAIWYNGGTSYTIAGGWSEPNFPELDQYGYLVNWDSATQTASDWRSYDFENGHTHVAISHFDGITTDNHGGFYLTGTWEGEGRVGGLVCPYPSDAPPRIWRCALERNFLSLFPRTRRSHNDGKHDLRK